MPRRKLPNEPPPADAALARSTLDIQFQEMVATRGDPRRKLFDLALLAEEQEDFATAARCWAELAQYVAPKLRSMEVQANVQATHVVFNIDLGDDDEPQDEGVTVNAKP